MDLPQWILVLGIPSAIFSAILGILVWWFKRYIEKRDAKQEKREENIEKLMLLMMHETRATNILSTATAKAVQRIPDAHCNGDMDKALAQAAKIQQEEKEFLIDHGIQHIFGD